MKIGDHGLDVEALQRNLLALGFQPGAPDGVYGTHTAGAVWAFQLEYTDVDDDGIAGPQTLARIQQALRQPRHAAPSTADVVPCNAETWSAFERLVDLVIHTPVRYGPGRGLWVGDKFVITNGPGSLGVNGWKNFLGKSYPSFHCTSWTNFFLGWLLRRNETYTHAGNIPDLFDLLSQDGSVHQNPGAGPYRGYGDACSPLAPDGSGATRSGVANVVDARELYDRRDSLPSFVVCGQSTRTAGGWRWWHHTVLFAMRDARLYRIAADGYRDAAKGYSAQQMRWVEITDANVGVLGAAIYRPYAVDTADGSFGDQSKPIAGVTAES